MQENQEEIKRILENKELKNGAKLVYVYLLLKQGDSEHIDNETFRTMSEGTSMTLTTVFNSVKELKSTGFVVQNRVDENVNQGYKYSVVKVK
jgi:Fe2+ or Zn2+ uptake regulation protein